MVRQVLPVSRLSVVTVRGAAPLLIGITDRSPLHLFAPRRGTSSESAVGNSSIRLVVGAACGYNRFRLDRYIKRERPLPGSVSELGPLSTQPIFHGANARVGQEEEHGEHG